MCSDSTKPLIFISYAHADEPPGSRVKWLSFVMEFLAPAVVGGQFTMWVDRQMKGGAVWEKEIEEKLRACDIFVLLVSPKSMASSFIIETEIKIARERQAAGDELHVFPLLLRPTPRAGLDRVRDFNLRPRDAKPFSAYPLNDREQHMSEAANEIADIAKEIGEKRSASLATQGQTQSPWKSNAPWTMNLKYTVKPGDTLSGIALRFFGNGSEQSWRRIYEANVATLSTNPNLINPGNDLIIPVPGSLPSDDAVRESAILSSIAGPIAAPPPLIDITGLPETGYERLVGRDAELARLDEAWSDDKTNILSLIAEGGAGKSALVNEWLTRLQADGYRGATSVLGWSFYSQGSKERATAADAFLDWALIKLDVTIDTTSGSAKGEAIAEALIKRRVLLVLDGVEPLQHGPGPQAGQLKDQGLRALLRRFATASPGTEHGLIVLTSRAAVADIKRFKDGAGPVVEVEKLSDQAGAELLRDNDVWGIDKELKAASREFGGHPLALTLLASYLKETQNGDVRRRDHIRGLLADADNPRHAHARRVMKSYETEWLADKPILLAILHCVGLFDRPASGDCLEALRAKPAILGLTDALVDLSDEQWRRAVERLRDVQLLAPIDPSDPEALDAHPLVREWFGERARLMNEAAWRAAHSRLYDHLRDTTHEGETPSLAGLAPLYHAVAHGCRAGRHQEALDEVYLNRICPRGPDGKIEFYARRESGSTGTNLAATAWFFGAPYEKPVAALTPPARAFVLSEASFALRAQGRLREALPAMRASLQLAEEVQDWRNSAISASSLSETELLVGDLSAATATAECSVALADRSRDTFLMPYNCTTLADALHVSGQWERAITLFADAERQQRQREPNDPALYSMQGYRYCDLLISLGRTDEARSLAMRAIRVARRNNWVLFMALDTLTLGRTHLAMLLRNLASEAGAGSASSNVRASVAELDESVESLRASGQNDDLPRGLIARAVFRRALGDWDGAARDIDEAKEIAEPAEMRLYLCDCALEGARLALARCEAFAPLNGLVDPSPPPPALPDPNAISLREEARKQLDVARKLIAECGYHRRDEELAELDAVIIGARRFADLPPRV